MSSRAPAMPSVWSCPPAPRVTASKKFEFAVPRMLTFSGAYCCTALRNSAAFSRFGSPARCDDDTVLESVTCVPCDPDRVVMSTTPFAPREP